MKRKLYLGKKGINIILIVCILGVSIYYSTGRGISVFNTVLKGNSSIPIHSVEKEEKVVSITINTGYGKQYTDEILDVLKKEDVNVTFFAMGGWIDRYKDSAKKIHKLDHEIGNNSLTYPHFTKISEENITKEVVDSDEKIKEITGDSSKLFRPPFGDYNEKVIKTISGIGYHSIIWDIDSLDLSNKTQSEISETVLKQVQNGSILLFHNNSEKTPGVLESTIKELKERGYSFQRTSEMIYKDNYYVDHTGRQRKVK